MANIFLIFISLLGIFFIGVLVGRDFPKIDGIFILDEMNEETIQWHLDVTFDPDELRNRNKVCFKVKNIKIETGSRENLIL